MTDFTTEHFEEICNSEAVKTQIETVETVRAAAVKQFWMILVGGLAATLAITVVASMVEPMVGGIAFFIGIVATFIFCLRPIDKVRKGLKQPMLEALAGRGGMQYAAAGFEPPFYMGARKALFGAWLSDQTFTDLFRGEDEHGRPFAFYEAHLEQGSGKNKSTVFQGQMYGFATSGGGQDAIVIVPDRGMFNFFKPGKGMERIKFESHPEFEKRFEVYAANPSKAMGVLGSQQLRERLLALRGKGKLFAYVDGDEALFAITGKDRFEPGSMFKATDGQQRARLMFDDVCGSVALLKELRAAFG